VSHEWEFELIRSSFILTRRDVSAMSSAERNGDEVHLSIEKHRSHSANKLKVKSQLVFKLHWRGDSTSLELEKICPRMFSSIHHPRFNQGRSEFYFSSKFILNETFFVNGILELFSLHGCQTFALSL
jgi:hypothetical protein